MGSTTYQPPVVVNPCPSRYYDHKCMHEAGHTNDHGNEYGAWSKTPDDQEQYYPTRKPSDH